MTEDKTYPRYNAVDSLAEDVPIMSDEFEESVRGNNEGERRLVLVPMDTPLGIFQNQIKP
jgi:hypothetical protein